MKSPFLFEKKYTLPPQGTFIARLTGIYYLGTQKVEWQGQVKDTPKVRFTFELPTELHEFKEGEGKKPFVITKDRIVSYAGSRRCLERGCRMRPTDSPAATQGCLNGRVPSWSAAWYEAR